MKTNGRLKEQSHCQSTYSDAASPWCNSAWKRGCDILGAGLLLFFVLPLMAVVALAVKLTSPGPVLYRQSRPGKYGREFSILKFRTMKAGSCHAGPAVTRPCDPRVTLFGRSMR